ncbi:MAG: sugar transferase [Mariprofundaceae bacterium]
MAACQYNPWDDAELLDEVALKYMGQQAWSVRVYVKLRWLVKHGLWNLVIRSTHIAKRMFDIAIGLFAMIALSPVFLFTWLSIKFEDGGPAFYAQERVGKWGKPFTMYKFRSMVLNADAIKDDLLDQNESEGGVIFKMKDDPRITRVGRWIRKLSIDELPQLLNVLKGDMSLVGPRPPVPREVAEYCINDRRRLDVIPGITCLWQVGGRSDIDFEGQVRLDVQYIREQGFWKDILILIKTVPAVLLGKGAY